MLTREQRLAALRSGGKEFTGGSAPSYPPDPKATGVAGANALVSSIPSAVTQTLGEEGGALGGRLLGGAAGGPIGGAIGAGIGGLGQKFLPKSLGGNPDMSYLQASGIPAALGAIGRIPKAVSEFKVARAEIERAEEFRKLGESEAAKMYTRIGESLKPDMPRASVMKLAMDSGYQPYSQEPTMSPIGRQEVSDTRQAVLSPIDRMRKAKGDPIGLIYSHIQDKQISPSEAQDLSSALQGIQDNAITTSPAALKLIKVAQGKLDEMPTAGELVQLRQEASKKLGAATQGADVHAFGDLRQAIDETLLNGGYFPSSMKGLYQEYSDFLKNYSWKDIRKFRQLGTAPQMADWLFKDKAGQAAEIIRQASPKEQVEIKRLYAQHVWDGVDPKAAPEEQASQIYNNFKKTRGAADAIYGSHAASAMETIARYPKNVADAAAIWKKPAIQRQWTELFMKHASQLDQVDQRAANNAFNDLFSTLDEADKEKFIQALPKPPGMEPVEQVPQVPGYMAQQMKNKANTSFLKHLPRFAVFSGLGYLLFHQGNSIPTYAGGAAIGVGGYKVYQWIINHGGAEAMSKASYFLARGKLNQAAQATLDFFIQVGGNYEQKRYQ